jgi:2-polyprenyl-3-methyl-5-hydroxy-6-metoxy-1,4-benzoquinol methylase
MTYYSKLRLDALSHVVCKGPHHILDVGCGEGVNGEYLKAQGFAQRVVGIEYVAAAADIAAKRLDKVICADLNALNLAHHEELNDFDYILCLDVLEHLIDPWERLQALARLLTPGGKLIVSLPNVRNWRVLYELGAHGQWEYRDAGIMDRTHLRFFTRESSIALLEQAGLHVAGCYPNMAGKAEKINGLLLGALTEFAAVQWLLVGRAADGNH